MRLLVFARRLSLPMVRYLARRGAAVVMAANQRPTLNDMTIHDVRAWWPRILEVEPSLSELEIELVSTGTGEPLIDLEIKAIDFGTSVREAVDGLKIAGKEPTEIIPILPGTSSCA